MSLLDALLILLAGIGAGGINAVVGSGTLVTFPTLLALGYPPVLANVSNNIGLVPGSVAGAWGYRRELVGQRGRVLRLGSASVLGGLIGAVLLLVLPEGAFSAVVPVLIAVGVVLVVLQPRLSRWVQARREHTGGAPDRDARWVWPVVLLTGIYGGYFGAAQGVILMGVLGIAIAEPLQRLNGIKNVMAGSVNAIAAVVFVLVADIDWLVVLVIAIGATIGGTLGGAYGRLLPPLVLRGVIVVVGVVALVALLWP